ncbi:MAG: S-adenosylmethionine:tRNA ribosyltransferase-isomerase [Culturomica sp.]|jgi:S-adenosylmethionine:tRNA ribosyltransferase-isomerase|nr:S-adenosylmethionine:tRNA ribosyltransferase-isomerase [Culturomica sp.]
MDIQFIVPKNIKIADYSYDLPDKKIACYPLPDREASRLLIYRDGAIRETVFAGTPELFGPSHLLVFNNTRVIHARLLFRKPTGAVIEVFCLEPLLPADYARNFAAIRCCEWSCMAGNLKKWREGAVTLSFEHNGQPVVLKAEKSGPAGPELRVRFSWDADITFSEVLECCGRIPIPPYLNREAEVSDRLRYQTVYSKEEGSVAAPTAGLHFTERLLADIRQRGAAIGQLTLHVGAGTFRPVKSDTVGAHEMHTEHILLNRELIELLLQEGKEITAVGTTSVRTLESLYWMGVKRLTGVDGFRQLSQWEAYSLPGRYSRREALKALAGWFEETGEEWLKAQTTILIAPGYRFRMTDAFFTNFHQPRSTLLLLVAAAVGEGWKEVYDYALSRDFRFLSYGDSSLLYVNPKPE